MENLTIDIVGEKNLENELEALADIIASTVNNGAAIGFMQPFSIADGRGFFADAVFPAVRSGERILLVARLEGVTIGTVQLGLALPPNQPHRCEVAKMMVHPDARRRGAGRALLRSIDDKAHELGKSLITLDTRSGDKSEALYRKVGFKVAGIIPGFALDPDANGATGIGRLHAATGIGRLHATTYMYKTL